MGIPNSIIKIISQWCKKGVALYVITEDATEIYFNIDHYDIKLNFLDNNVI